MSEELAGLLAKNFIQRRDVKARQYNHGGYSPVTNCPGNGCTHENDVRLPFTMADLLAHLSGQDTFGHYLLDHDDNTRMFAFDIDLEKNKLPDDRDPSSFTGRWCELPDAASLGDNVTNEEWESLVKVHEFDARESWMNRDPASRAWTKTQLRMMAEKLSRTVYENFDIPVACAYSGSKGVHVYAFTGVLPAHKAREAAEMTLELAGGFVAARGNSFFKTIDQSPLRGFPNLSIEVFPKQSSLDGKDLGNLMRLPLGRNRKTSDPTFFIDQKAPMSQLAPHADPVALLNSGNPWA